MPWGPSSRAIASARMRCAALVGAKPEKFDLPRQADVLPVTIIAPLPRSVSVWAEAPGYVSFPPQNVADGDTIYLAAAPNRVVNGAFAFGLTDWQLSGSAPPQ